MSLDLYAILGVPRDADAGAIKKAYRKLAMQHHPDREGGNHVKFKEVKLAYETLSDPERRARYDNGGGYDEVDSVEERAKAVLLSGLAEKIDGGVDDPIGAIVADVTGQLLKLQAQLDNFPKVQQKLRRLMKRARKKGDGPNFVHEVAERKLKVLTLAQAEIEDLIETSRKVLDMCSDYELGIDFDSMFADGYSLPQRWIALG